MSKLKNHSVTYCVNRIKVISGKEVAVHRDYSNPIDKFKEAVKKKKDIEIRYPHSKFIIQRQAN